MKNYNQFLNELRTHGKMNDNIPINFEFAINVKDSSDQEKMEILSELGKNFEIDDYIKNALLKGQSNKPWTKPSTWFINIWESCGNAGQRRLTLKFDPISTTNIVTAKEFLEVGIEGVKIFIDSKKYNI